MSSSSSDKSTETPTKRQRTSGELQPSPRCSRKKLQDEASDSEAEDDNAEDDILLSELIVGLWFVAHSRKRRRRAMMCVVQCVL